MPRVQLKGLRELNTVTAYNLQGNFGGKFPSNGTGFFGTEDRNRIELYHLQNIGKVFASSGWSLALVIQTNGTENFGRFGKNGKKVIPRKVFTFFRKISTGMNCSIWILPGISGFFHTNGKRSVWLVVDHLVEWDLAAKPREIRLVPIPFFGSRLRPTKI